MKHYSISLIIALAISGCSLNTDAEKSTSQDSPAQTQSSSEPKSDINAQTQKIAQHIPEIKTLKFIDEYVLPSKLTFNGTTIGGLSGIDAFESSFYLISDDNNNPNDKIIGAPRYYKAKLQYDDTAIFSAEINQVTSLSQKDGTAYAPFLADPEGIRVVDTNLLIWISEGNIKQSVPPSINKMDNTGRLIAQFEFPKYFASSIDKKSDSGLQKVGPRHNAVFEGISLTPDKRSVWVAMEGPLYQDGHEASFNDGGAPVRISRFNIENGHLEQQFVYPLNPVTQRQSNENNGKHQFHVNGIVDILQINATQMLVLERSYVAGQKDGGNDVYLYSVDISQPSDTKELPSLAANNFSIANKTLLFDFNKVRELLTTIDGHHVVDNIEGMTLAAPLKNGKATLMFVADDNFSLYGKQLNQFLLFQIN